MEGVKHVVSRPKAIIQNVDPSKESVKTTECKGRCERYHEPISVNILTAKSSIACLVRSSYFLCVLHGLDFGNAIVVVVVLENARRHIWRFMVLVIS